MIWNADFVWIHQPKCAGTKTEEIFRVFYSDRSDIHQDVASHRLDPTIRWHDSLSQRKRNSSDFCFEEKVIICGFRRLIPWLISMYNHQAQRSPHLPHDPEMLFEGKFLTESGDVSSADNVALNYLPEEIVFSDKIRLVRTENFQEDFIEQFSPFIDTSVIPEHFFSSEAQRVSKSIASQCNRQIVLGRRRDPGIVSPLAANRKTRL